VLFYDSETFSEAPLKTVGTWNYARHPSTEVTLVSYALDDGPEQLWDRTKGEPMPHDLEDRIYDERELITIANSFFDRTVARETNLFPGIILPPERIIDTMVQALCHGLPGGLDKLGQLFGLSEDEAKMKEGRALMHLFCKPGRGGQRNTWQTHPDKWEQWCAYAKRDVTAMRIIAKKLPRWNYPGLEFPSAEHRMWCLDQRINDRGFMADRALAEAAVKTAAQEKDVLNAATFAATEGEVGAATQRDELLGYIVRAYGITLPDMKADTLQRRIEDESLPQAVRDLLALRVASSRNTSAKYKSLLLNLTPEDRLHGSLQFCGAATTGRWSGRVFQPQNLMRPTLKVEVILEAIEAIKAGAAHFVYDNLAEVLGNCVRGVIIAPPKKKLVVCDLASIEGRGLAWLAGEEPVIQFYRDLDDGVVEYDAYMLAYASVFGIDPMHVTKAMRQIGKPIELAFGYGGGVAAFLTFALVYHLDLDDLAEKIWAVGDAAHLSECESKYEWAKKHRYHGGMDKRKFTAFEYTKQRWRTARPVTVAFWEALKQGFEMATAYEKQIFTVGPIKFMRSGQWLRMRLPSGRNIVFLQPKADSTGLSYMGINRYTRQWARMGTHGGKLAGIATQAFAGDVLRAGMLDLEADEHEIVLTVHDEAISEVPDSEEFTVERMAAWMTAPRAWAPGLPLAADGFETYRYRKGD
jgi:DNA polymerase